MRRGRAGGPAGRGADGTTLVELLVVLVVLASLATLSSVAVMSLRPTAVAAAQDTVRALRARAIREGVSLTQTVDSVTMRLLPDGRVLGGAADPLTGTWSHDR